MIHTVIHSLHLFSVLNTLKTQFALYSYIWKLFVLFFNLAPFFNFFFRVSLCRKASEDLPASEYYKIYQQSKKNSTNIIPENNVVDIVEPLEEALDMESKTGVKVQGGGIAER